MPWVIKIPKRPDFCGAPPCPLCFNWVEDDRRPIEDQQQTEGFEKMKADMVLLLGRPLTPSEVEQLRKTAEEIHLRNRAPARDPALEAFNEAADRRAKDFLFKESAKPKAQLPPLRTKDLNKRNLDDMIDSGELKPMTEQQLLKERYEQLYRKYQRAPSGSREEAQAKLEMEKAKADLLLTQFV